MSLITHVFGSKPTTEQGIHPETIGKYAVKTPWRALGILSLLAAIGVAGYYFLPEPPAPPIRSTLPMEQNPPPASIALPTVTPPPLSAPQPPLTRPQAPRPKPALQRHAPTDTPAPPSMPPPEPETDLMRAYANLQRHELERARHDYTQALRHDPNNADALLALSALAQHQGFLADAEQFRQRALIANPSNPWVQAAALGSTHTARVPANSESRLRALLQNQPESAPLNFALGNILATEQRWHEAQSHYFTAVAADGDNPDYLFNLAISLDRIRQSRPAAQHYRLALEAAQKRPAAFDGEQAKRRLAELAPTLPANQP